MHADPRGAAAALASCQWPWPLASKKTPTHSSFVVFHAAPAAATVCRGVCDRLWSVRASEVGFADRHRSASASRLGATQQARAAQLEQKKQRCPSARSIHPHHPLSRRRSLRPRKCQTPPANARAFRPPKAWQIVHATEASQTKSRRRMSVSPSAQTAVPVDPANAAPRCGCTGCESFWLPQLRRLAS